MSSEISETRPLKGGVMAAGVPNTPHPPEPENLQCPRCESTNTKFCYYNNYNLSQPRYFCKSCRRYWTRGGSLRNIPVGGGSRKNSKRSRSSSSSSATSAPATPQTLPPPISPVACNSAPNDSVSTPNFNPVSFGIKTETNHTPTTTLCPLDMNLNEAIPGSFSSLLGSQHPGGFLGLGGYGLGLGSGTSSGFDMLGFGFGKSVGDWPGMENVNGVGSSGGSSSGCNTWQMETVDAGGLTEGGDCFGWPDLAISTPGTAGLE